jgi:hypothetical protein
MKESNWKSRKLWAFFVGMVCLFGAGAFNFTGLYPWIVALTLGYITNTVVQNFSWPGGKK